MAQFKTKQKVKQDELQLTMPSGKKVSASFDGGDVCSDGGLLLLRKADERLGLSRMAANCMHDERRPDLVTHTFENMFKQRTYGIATGYEDCNDAGSLRFDAMHQLAVGYEPSSGHALASQPTLSRFEGAASKTSNALMQKCLTFVYSKLMKRKPKKICLSMDTTCDVVYGYQQLSCFNGYYGESCYAPLLIFTDDGFPLRALLRPGSPNPAEDALRVLKELVKELRGYFPGVKLELKADAAFANPELLKFLEQNGITYYIGAIGHAGLAYHAEELIAKCKKEFDSFGEQSPGLKKYAALPMQNDKYALRAAERQKRQNEERIRYSSKEEGRMQEHFEDEFRIRRFAEFHYQSREWDEARRFICRVEYTKHGPDTRFIVTNAKGSRSRKIYEDKYCRRAQCENWIKDLKTYLKCDRTSCQEFEQNQFRLILHVFAYVLIWETRTRAKLPAMTVETFRLHLLKVGVLVKENARGITLSLPTHFVWKDQIRQSWLAS
ncbi:MAG: IS1380 family transposase [Candidatus Obscuribacterales bacterium]|nr:IS1380 family transposase [Candidatus Obscuribacterales bacterium]